MESEAADTYSELGQRLRYEREMRGWSRSYVAEKLGTTPKNVGRWERGESVPDSYYRENLCKFYNKNAVELGFMSHLKQNDGVVPSVDDAATNSGSSIVLLNGERGALLLNLIGELAMTFDDSKRKTLEFLFTGIGTAVTTSILELFDPETEKRLLQSTLDPTSLDEKTLVKFEKVTANCWLLLKFDGLSTVEQLLPTYLPQIATFSQQPSKYQERAARIAAQGFILKGLVAVLNSNISESIQYCKKAIAFAKIAGDPTLEAAAFKHLAAKYQDNGQPQQTLQTYLEVLPSISDVSPLLQGRTYLGLALAYAQTKQEKDARYYLDLAHASFPEQPEDDPGYSYADCNTSSLNHYGGLIYQEFEQFEKARETFAAVDTLSSKTSVPERTRLEILNCQTEASLALRDLKSSLDLIEASARGAMKLESEKRYNDAFSLYRQSRLLWPREPQVKELADLFQR